jgi:hypothetical protein
MDLPTEIRLCIAEYALLSSPGKELTWKWSESALKLDDKIVGYFTNLGAITPLRLVSRQIYKETEGLVWKVNTLYFNELDLEGFHWQSFGTLDGTVEQAFEYFVRNVGSKASSYIRSLVFKIYRPDNEWFLYGEFDSLNELFKPFPAAQVQIYDLIWPTYRIAFWETGHKYKDELAKVGYGDKNGRNWRVFPTNLTGQGDAIPDKLAAVLDEAQSAEVLDWLKNGIWTHETEVNDGDDLLLLTVFVQVS